eukprot:jgi/Bigna1/83550/fgenesh1_pg.110_\
MQDDGNNNTIRRQEMEHAPLLRGDAKQRGTQYTETNIIAARSASIENAGKSDNDHPESSWPFVGNTTRFSDHGLVVVVRQFIQFGVGCVFTLIWVSAIVIVFAVCINWTTDGLLVAALLRGKSDSPVEARILSMFVAVISLLFRVFYATCILWVAVSASKEMIRGLREGYSPAVRSFISKALDPASTCTQRLFWMLIFIAWIILLGSFEFLLVSKNLYGHFGPIFWYTMLMGSCTITGLCLLFAEYIRWCHQIISDPRLPESTFQPTTMLCTFFRQWKNLHGASWFLLAIHSIVHIGLFPFTLWRLQHVQTAWQGALALTKLLFYVLSFILVPYFTLNVVPTFLNYVGDVNQQVDTEASPGSGGNRSSDRNGSDIRWWLWIMCLILTAGFVSIGVPLVYNGWGAWFGASSISIFFGILWSVVFDNHIKREGKKLNFALVVAYLLITWCCFTMVLLHISSSPPQVASPAANRHDDSPSFSSPPLPLMHRKAINHSLPVYGICQKDWYGLSALELGEIARISYEIPSYSSEESLRETISNMTQYLNNFLCSPLALVEPRPPFNRVQYCPFSVEMVSSSPPFFAHIKGGNLNVIAIRGSADVLDFFEDFQVWSEIGTLQLVSFIVPLYHLWPVRLAAQYAWLVDLAFQKDMYVRGVERYMHNAGLIDYKGKDPFKRVLLTGHSLGGGLAAIIGARTDHRSIGFSSPGATLQHVKFNFEWESLRKTSTTIFSYGDYVPNFDIHSGLIQAVMCRASEGLKCHSLHDLLCEIVAGCPALPDLYLTDEAYWNNRRITKKMSENFWQRSRGKRRSAPARGKSKKEVEELVAKLSAMGFSENDCRKALKSTNYIEQEAVNILLNNPSKPSNKKSPRKKSPARTKKKSRYLPPPPFAALEEDVEFEKGNFLDCRDKYGMWLEAEVVKLRNDEVLIHYNNWDSKWDEWIPLKDKDKFAPFHRLSVHGKQTKYRMNAKVAIWGPNGLRKWFQGVITDIKHKQVKVTYDESSKNRDCDYWYHYESPDICLIQDFDSYQERLRTQVVDDDPDSNTEEWYEGKMIEVLDTAKKWLPAEVLKVKKRKGGGHMLFVSYENWDSSWDEWIDTIKAKGRVRPLGITLKESEKEREIRELHEAFRKDLKERYDFECLFGHIVVVVAV